MSAQRRLAPERTALGAEKEARLEEVRRHEWIEQRAEVPTEDDEIGHRRTDAVPERTMAELTREARAGG